jgi:hypothetical protein
MNLDSPGRGGGFDFVGVPPGQYILRAVGVPPSPARGAGLGRGASGGAPRFSAAPDGPTWWAAQPIAVVDQDQIGLTIVLQAGARLSGRVQFQGTAPPPAAERFALFVAAVDNLNASRTNSPTAVSSAGTFRTVGLPPGRYLLRLAGTVSPWRLKSVVADGRDVTEVPIELETGGIDDVLVTLTDAPFAALTGVVRTARGEPDPSSVVFVFPADRRLWVNLGPTALRFRTAPGSSTGAYSLGALPDGDYLVAAGPEALADEWLHSSVLETLALRATRVQIAEGERRTLDLVRSDR